MNLSNTTTRIRQYSMGRIKPRNASLTYEEEGNKPDVPKVGGQRVAARKPAIDDKESEEAVQPTQQGGVQDVEGKLQPLALLDFRHLSHLYPHPGVYPDQVF